MSEPCIRLMRPEDLEPTVAAIRDGGWGERRPELSLYVGHPQITIFVADHGGEIVGTAITTLSAGVGWLGLVFVAPALRGKGLGSRLTRTGLEYFREQGSRSILLAASDLGRPIYEKLGFDVDGEYAIMVGPGLVDWRSPSGLRSLEQRDLTAIGVMDRAATAEDRRHMLEAVGTGWVVDRDGNVSGYALRSPWGFGPVVANDADSGRVLLDVLRAQAPSGEEMRLMVPRENTTAIQHLAQAGFEQRATLPRMRLGDPVPWQPRRIWATFNAAMG